MNLPIRLLKENIVTKKEDFFARENHSFQGKAVENV